MGPGMNLVGGMGGGMGSGIGSMVNPMAAMGGSMGMGMGGGMGGMMGSSTGPSMGGGGTLGSSSVEILMASLRMIPPQVAQDPRGFSLRCAVPNRLVGGLLGRGGCVAREIREMTGARIDIPQNPTDPDNRAMSITGPLFSCVAAYIYMMKQYVETEAAHAQRATIVGTGPNQAPLPGQNSTVPKPPTTNSTDGSAQDMTPQSLSQMEQQLQSQLTQIQQMQQQLASVAGTSPR